MFPEDRRVDWDEQGKYVWKALVAYLEPGTERNGGDFGLSEAFWTCFGPKTIKTQSKVPSKNPSKALRTHQKLWVLTGFEASKELLLMHVAQVLPRGQRHDVHVRGLGVLIGMEL